LRVGKLADAVTAAVEDDNPGKDVRVVDGDVCVEVIER
jgi:hypothetical protein